MAIKLQEASRNAAADGILNRLQGGTLAGYVEIRTGAGPADPDSAANGTLLVTILLNDPAFGAASAGVATLDNSPAPTGDAVAAGTAGYARFYDDNDAPVMDMDIGEGSGTLSLDNTDIAVDQTVTITSGTITMPDGQ